MSSLINIHILSPPDKISGQAMSLLPRFPRAIIVQACPRTVEASSPRSFKESSLMWVSLCLTLLLPTGFGHMTVHFSSGAHDLPAMLSLVYWYRHPNLCLFWPGIEPVTPRLRATRLAFYHYAKGTEIKSQGRRWVFYLDFPIAIIVQACPRTVEASSPRSFKESSLMWVSLCFNITFAYWIWSHDCPVQR